MMSPRYDLANAVYDGFWVCGQWRREVSCFAADGMGIIAMSSDDAIAHVEFDFFRIWGAMKAAPVMPKMAYMYHTHPPGIVDMSPEDANSVKGWVTALGMPIEMMIICGDSRKRYLCLKGNVIIENFRNDSQHVIYPPEAFLATAMKGMSSAASVCSPEVMDLITEDLNRIIGIAHWHCNDCV